MKSVELFVGAGGLAMGVAKAGFKHDVVIEKDKFACETIRENQRCGIKEVVNWPLREADVRDFDYSYLSDKIDLLSGGPPCQPFSIAGKHNGHDDERDMFPEGVRAIRELRPRAVAFENVSGLTRKKFSSYLGYIILQITNPLVSRNEDESWKDHLHRLENCRKNGLLNDLFYRVAFRVLDAADFGVPQRRKRVFIVGFRSDLEMEWTFPGYTHSHDALLWDQWVTADYWDRHRVPRRHRPGIAPKNKARVDRLRSQSDSPVQEPWQTVRDAIGDLPDPERSMSIRSIPNHRFNPGARSYPGHTGSPLDEPAKTLKAGDHGVPGGENMLARTNGKVRYFTVRETARLQTFPDDYVFHGSWTECMRQLGNAVPVTLAKFVASDIKARLEYSGG